MRIFVTDDMIGDGRIRITGGDASHLGRSLRMAPGERLTVCDMSRREYICETEKFGADYVVVRIISSHESENEPPYRAYAYIALSKGERMDSAVQKCVELGVTAIIPFESERSIVGASDALHKTERRQRIADEAAKQCGRGILPVVREPITFTRVLDELSSGGLNFMCYEGDGTVPITQLLHANPEPDEIRFITGPEGGFSAEEVNAAAKAGITSVGLGRRILRCETAPAFVLALLSYEYEI